MNYQELYDLQLMKQRRESMEKSYPRERETKLRQRKNQLLAEKKDLLLLEEKLRGQLRESKRLQDEKDGITEEIHRINEDLYSGKFSPKELTGMQNRLETLERNQENRQEQIGRGQAEIREKRAELRAKKEELLERMKDYEAKVEEYLQEKNRLVDKLHQLDEQIEGVASALDGAELLFYQEESEKYGTEILSVLRKGRFCASCSILLETETIYSVKSERGGVRCQNCGRVICNIEE